MKKIAAIPLSEIDRVEIRVTNCRKSRAQVKAESGAAYILNGGMWNADGSPCPLLKVDGKVLADADYDSYGYGWDAGPDIRLTPSMASRNFISCTCLIAPWGPVDKPSYDRAQGGKRGRSAMGIQGGALCLYCSSDARTPEGLRDELAALGWESAVMLDGGGSSQCDFAGETIRASRKVHNWICVYTKAAGSEPPPDKGDESMSKQYTVTPSVGVNIRKGPGTGYDKVGGYSKGTVVTVLEEKTGWGRTDKGWVKLSNLSMVTGTGGSVATGRKTDTGVSIKEMLVAQGRKNRPGGVNPCKYITIHETGNQARGADAEAHGPYLRGDSAQASRVSWHYTVDEDSIVQHIPDKETAYHAGDGANGPGNAESIGIEICVNADGDFERAKANAASLVRLLMAEHKIPAERIKQHHDWSGKDCPYTIRHTSGAWERFLTLCKGSGQTASPYRKAVQTRFGFADSTMDYLEAYEYANALLERLATED